MKKKKTIYLVFEKIPQTTSGGLLGTYLNLIKLFSNDYNFKIISVFNYENNESFANNEKLTIINKSINTDFPHIIKHFKERKLKKVFMDITSSFKYFASINKAKRTIKNIINKDDICIVTSPAAAIFMPKIPFILEVHIKFEYFFGKNFLGKLQSKLMTKPSITLFRTRDDAIKASKTMNADYIYNFIDNSEIVPSKGNIKNKIIYLGRLNKVKDPLRLLDIFEELLKIKKNVTLDIYGTGPLESKLKEEIVKKNLQKHVKLKGFTNNKNIYAEYSLMWMTSKIEGLPLTVIEAKANGIPTISTNWGNGVFEVIEDKKNGYIIDNNKEYAQITKKVLSNSVLQKKLSSSSIESFKLFSKEEARKKWIKIFNNYK